MPHSRQSAFVVTADDKLHTNGTWSSPDDVHEFNQVYLLLQTAGGRFKVGNDLIFLPANRIHVEKQICLLFYVVHFSCEPHVF